MNRSIGVFDSGVGGLTVVRELFKKLPNERIIYFGDTARVPYGIKSKSTIIRFSLENILFLLKQNVKMIVVACNTSSSIALPILKRHFKIPIVGVIVPGVKEAVFSNKNKRIGVIGTKATIGSGAYQKEIKKLDSQVRIFVRSCPLLVPLAEENWLNEESTEDIVKKYLAPFKKAKVDTLILGCTHYPLLKNSIQNFMGRRVSLIDSSEQVALETKHILARAGMLANKRRKNSKNIIYVSDESESFREIAKRILGSKFKNIRKKSNV
ncbi:glutamate racemase [Candidatus Omnitrophota bacterium]